MKKMLALTLAMALLLSCTCMATAEDFEFVLPFNRSEVAYPELETMPTVTTKTRGDNITVTFSEPVDELKANLLGYQEEAEIVELDENNQATFSKEGHKYQLGTHWVNWSYTWDEYLDWYDYETPDSEIEVPEGATLEVEEPYISVERATPTGEYDTWVDEEGNEHEYEVINYEIIATYPADTDESTIEVPEGCEIWHYSGGKYVVIPHTEGGRGYGNSAYIAKKGDFTATYKRNGALLRVTKEEKGTADYFQVGRAGDGFVQWVKSGKIWYISSASVSYDEGDIAQIGVTYQPNGFVDHYYVVRRFEDNQYYETDYNRNNKRVGGYYWQTDSEDEDKTIRSAYANSLDTWLDNETGKLTNSQKLDWGLLSPTDDLFVHSGRKLSK